MDKNFQDLLVRYVNGHCTPEEIEKVNQWYEEIEDRNLQLDAEEKGLMRARMLTNIQSASAAPHKPFGRQRNLLFRPLFRVAAAVLVLMAFGLWLFTGTGLLTETRLVEVPAESTDIVYENQTGVSKLFKLPDGSTVNLGATSRIHFKKFFLGENREVYLTGKAFFDIVKDPDRPFYVYSGKIATRVLGTSFFVDAPANASMVGVKVITGKVSVFQITANASPKDEKHSTIKNSTANGVVLSPNQKVEYFIEDDHWVTGLVENPVPITRPADGQTISFVFDNAPLNKVLNGINERYGIEVVTENEKIWKCTFTGDVSRMSLYDMLDVICNSIGSTYEVKGTRILISGKGCN